MVGRRMGMEGGNSKRSAITEAIVFELLCVINLLASGYLMPAFAQKLLDPDEVEILRQIHTKYKLKLWNFSFDPCSGQGNWNMSRTAIGCDCNNDTSKSEFCHVSKIKLKSQNINGEVPEEFADLPSLSHIELNRNNFHGNIPPSWASLPLKFLSFIGNNLTGPLPEWIGNITTLENLLLENNLFSGSLPISLGNLPFLNSLLLSCNQFTGNIPESLGNLTNLKDFRIDGNDFSGIIPNFFVRWTKLERLYMQGTSLEGPIPSGFSSLKNIEQLRVTDINISGTFPPLQNMKLEHLTLRNLQLSGPLPEYIGDMKNLEHLDLSFNSFTGEIPLNYKKLKDYKLQILIFTSNNLSGEIPDWFNRMNVDFSYNLFSGPQRQSCQDGEKNLVASYAPNKSNINDLSPCLLRNLPCSEKPMNYELFINCGGQAVTVDNKTYVANTQTSSPSYFYESSDKRWGFSSTGFFEGIKGGKYTFNYTTTNQSSLLDTRNEQLYTSARLNPLSLRYYGFCLQKGPYNVSLHFAEIMFTDDNTVSSNGRRIFDVSIQGQKVLKNFEISKNAGGVRKGIVRSFNTSVDSGTLEIHFQWLGKGTQQVPDRGVYGSLVSAISVTPNFDPDRGKNKKLSVGQISGIVLSSCAVLVLLVLSLLFVWQRKKHEKSAEFKALESMTGYFNLSQIKSATQNFAPENKIGEGGFGPVYKGELHDGTLIAVKQLSSKSRQGNREFLNEIGMISALQHPNLVKLYGCSVEGNQLMVIYEYMKNNSLAAALFGKGGMKMNLDWPSRCKIIQDIARGLAYLHEESIIKIVHRDIKASNILLDKNLNAKISDFGLAKLNEEEDTHISTRVAGTIGYMAPEYAMRGYLTEKADVYSFGIVVLEILSGKSNTDFTPKEDCFCLLDWANALLERKNTIELIDPIINRHQYIQETHQMLNLVFWCTNQSPSLRPVMSTIVSMLEGNTSFPAAPMKYKRTEGNSEAYNGFQNNFNDSQLLEDPLAWSTFNSMFHPRG